jgi:integrase
LFILADGSPISVPFLQMAFQRIAREAETRDADHCRLKPHSVRHTAATWARMKGAPVDRIAALLGHADLRMTMRISAHIRADDPAGPLDVLAGVEKRAREEAREKKAAK